MHAQLKSYGGLSTALARLWKLIDPVSQANSALKSGPVPVLGSSGLGPWTGPVLIFPNMEGPQTGPHKTGFTRSWAVLGPVLLKTDS